VDGVEVDREQMDDAPDRITPAVLERRVGEHPVEVEDQGRNPKDPPNLVHYPSLIEVWAIGTAKRSGVGSSYSNPALKLMGTMTKRNFREIATIHYLSY
jgi:hypothetical protein